jgi:hypothetical protein
MSLSRRSLFPLAHRLLALGLPLALALTAAGSPFAAARNGCLCERSAGPGAACAKTPGGPPPAAAAAHAGCAGMSHDATAGADRCVMSPCCGHDHGQGASLPELRGVDPRAISAMRPALAGWLPPTPSLFQPTPSRSPEPRPPRPLPLA